ncbi:MAG TPA: cobalamin biosynthesis protein, partial [Bacillota bacterium]|nr:cobalamin biosynthesis protein [Bacillota bacterium]
VKGLAESIGATAVLTSTVEKRKVPLLDDLAKQYKMNIESRDLIPKFTNALLNGEPVVIWDRWGLNVQWPENVRVETGVDLQFGNNEKLLLVIGYQNIPAIVPVKMQVMALRPVCLTVGIGCCKGVNGLRVIGAVRRYFREQNWSVKSIKQLVSVDMYADQNALADAGRDLGVSVIIFNVNEFPKSGSPLKIISNGPETEQGQVAETVALLSAQQGQLIGIKRRIDQVSIAVAFSPEEKSIT